MDDKVIWDKLNKFAQSDIPDEEIIKWFSKSWVDINDWLSKRDNNWKLLSEKNDELSNISEPSNISEEERLMKIWTDAVNGLDPKWSVVKDAEKLAGAYQNLIKEKNKITSKNDSWYWMDPEYYKEQLSAINEVLSLAENSKEFKDLIDRIDSRELSVWQNKFNPITTSILQDMAMHKWSEWLNDQESFNNWRYWDLANSNFARLFAWWNNWNDWDMMQTSQDLKWLKSIYDRYNFSWDIESNEQNNSSNDKNNKDEKLNKQSLTNLIKWNEYTDRMSFWWDVKDKDYLDKRNKILAIHLKMNWIETPEEIEEYLNKYPSWKNAKQEWKDNTVNILTDKVSKIKWINEDWEQVLKEENKKWFGWKWWKENEDGSKTSPDWTTTVREDWSISFWTDDESPLNDVETVEEDKKQTKKWKKIQSKAWTKKEVKKVEKVSKSSPTILNLIKAKK